MPMSPTRADKNTEPRRFGIRARLLALLLPGIVALLALDSWNDYHALSETVANAYDQSLLEPVKALGNSIVVRPDGKVQVHEAFSVEAMFAATSARYKHLHVGITPVGTDGPETTLMGVPDLPPPPVAPPEQSVGKPVFYDAWYQGRPVRIAALRQTVYDTRSTHDIQGAGDTSSNAAWQVLIQAAESTGPRTRAVNESLQQELWRDARMLLVVTLLVWLGVAWTLRPLERLRASLRERQPDDLKPLDPTGIPQEVMPLVDAVNHHIESHRTMVAEHSQFLADASHQLRTPLAILSIQAGYAVRETDPERMRESLRAIVTQLARTRRLSEQLLALAHATHQDNAGGAPALVDLNAVARAVVLQYLPLARENDQDLGWIDARGDLPFERTDEAAAGDADGEPTRPVLPVHANEAELHEVLSNLVHNAIKYTPRGGSITVSVRRDARYALAEVCDSGPGISADRRASVFQRFQRDASSDARATQGAGLGLTIARSYARRNHGDIELADAGSADGASGPASTAGAGLRATLRLPLANLK
ncbi:sensor histidine kinase [Variovorax sp. PAMC28562]|uniref:sensor histidine kinase n=1 Tax=Variovorax sp. PAMC28562 TaxID=2762323 RepID=UPI00164DF857|nr:sensor histidine kinase [Variovorax sp. PAMC28562]QNK73332.1 sensor histidine kinase [Variovorax sp. PAMC28562]